MPRHDKDPAKPSWRDAQPSPAAESAADRAPRAAEIPQQQSWRAIGSRRARPVWRKLGAGAGVVVSGALIVWLLTLPSRPTAATVVARVVTFENCSVPPTLASYSPPHHADTAGAAPADKPDGIHRDAFRRSLQSVPGNGPLLVVLQAPGASLSTDKPPGDVLVSCVLFSDFNPDHASGWYTLDQLWEDLRALSPDRHKLLLIDDCGGQTDWRLGRLENWFLDDLRRQMELEPIPRLAVISARSPFDETWPGERSAKAEAFADFAAAGLAGPADANHDTHITVAELYEYLNGRSGAWCRAVHLASGRHPLLIGAPDSQSQASLPVLPAGRSDSSQSVRPAAAEREQASVWTPLDELWRERERLRGKAEPERPGAAYQIEPLRWRWLTHALLRAEEYRMVGATAPGATAVASAKQALTELNQALAADVLAKAPSESFIGRAIVQQIVTSPGQHPPAAEAGPGRTAAKTGSKDLLLLPDAILLKECEADQEFPAPTPNPEIVATRRLAEEAACAALGTPPFVAAMVLQADVERRRAEDGWFARQTSEWIEEHRQTAESGYRTAIEIQTLLRRTQTMRNRMLAELPELAHWTAFRANASADGHCHAILQLYQTSLAEQPGRLPSIEALAEQRRTFEKDDRGLAALDFNLLMLFQLARTFEQRLDNLAAAQGISAPELQIARDQLDQSVTLLADVERDIDRHARRLAEDTREWGPADRELNHLLLCPALSAQQRERLQALRADRRTQPPHLPVVEATAAPTESFPQSPRDRRFERAEWHALWAIQALSRGPADKGSAAGLWEQWAKLPRHDDRALPREIARLGGRIRQEFLANAAALESQIQPPSPAKADDRSDAPRRQAGMDRARAGDHAARCYLDYCASQHFAGGPNPAETFRKHGFGELLLAQGRRYLDDYWANWYEPAVEACLAAAKELSVADQNDQRERLQNDLALRKAAQVGLAADNVAFGTSRSKTVQLSLTTASGLPSGDAAVWLGIPEGSGLIVRKGYRRSVALPASGTSDEGGLRFELDKTAFDAAGCPKLIAVRPRIYFRGHRWEDQIAPVSVDPCAPAGARFSFAPDPLGKALVSGRDDRTVLFILDCSAAMNLPAGNPRFPVVTATLGRAFEQVAEQNQTQSAHAIGLMAFGQRSTSGSAGPAEPALLNAIRPVNSKSLAELDATLNELQAGGGSPLLAAVAKGCDEFARRKTGGTIVVLAGSLYRDRNVSTATVDDKLRELRTKGLPVALNVIGYQLTRSALDEADQATYDRMRRWLDADGSAGLEKRFVESRGPDELLRQLAALFDPRPYSIAPIGPRDVRIPASTESLLEREIELPAGGYELRFPGVEPVEFNLAAGEQREFTLDANRLVPRPPPARSTPHFRESVGSAPAGFSFGYGEFQVDVESRASFLVSIAPDSRRPNGSPPKGEKAAESIAIAEADFELTGEGDAEPAGWEVSRPAGYAALTWRMTVPRWPVKETPAIEATWKSTRTHPDLKEHWSDLRAPSELNLGAAATELPRLTLLRRDYEGGKVRLELQLGAALDGKPQPIAATALTALRKLRVEMQKRGTAGVTYREIGCRAKEFHPGEGKLLVEFDMPEGSHPDDFDVLLTTWSSLSHDAYRSAAPLKVRPSE